MAPGIEDPTGASTHTTDATTSKGIFFMFEHYRQSPEGFPAHGTWFGPPVLLHLFLTISTHIGQGGESLLSNSMPPFME